MTERTDTTRVHRRPYTNVPRAAAEDQRLSFRARGLLLFMLSKPDGWQFSADRIAAESLCEGRKAVRNALAELRAAGYYRVVRHRVGRSWVMVTEVAEDPALMPPDEVIVAGYRPVKNRPDAGDN